MHPLGICIVVEPVLGEPPSAAATRAKQPLQCEAIPEKYKLRDPNVLTGGFRGPGRGSGEADPGSSGAELARADAVTVDARGAQ
jgi:hypothetical protein